MSNSQGELIKTEIDNKVKSKTRNSIKKSILNHLTQTLAKDKFSATKLDMYTSVALTVREYLSERWSKTQRAYHDKQAKRIYYLSLEFLMGKSLINSLVNLGLYDEFDDVVKEFGTTLQEIDATEFDAGLGNGGLGRLAACFLDSMATMGLPGYGYGIRYEYGIFFQKIVNGYQIETPDPWLRYGNPWEIPRPELLYPVKFYGYIAESTDAEGKHHCEWKDASEVMAMAHDISIPGYKNNTVNNLRLWAAKSTREFDLSYFNHGNYEQAVSDKVITENLSKVLYPNDNMRQGKELRLKQEYFFVSATLQDIIRRYKKYYAKDFSLFPDKTAIQLNDTHPAVAIAELMRLLIDGEKLTWDESWAITTKTFAYTNHTVLPEALEKWSVELFAKILPRHMQIIYEINSRFLNEVAKKFPKNSDILGRMSIIEEGEDKKVQMAHLAIVGSHSVNGVSALHSDIIKDSLFKDFYLMWPSKFNNKTNGITPRRWLVACNPALSNLITEAIGDKWVKDLYKLKELTPFANDNSFLEKWEKVKLENKQRLSEYILKANGIKIDPESLFDCQIKRLHEYKRQLLNILHAISLYNILKENPKAIQSKRTIIFGGKAAPGYHMAKLIIKLATSAANVINNDKDIDGMLKIVFLANYGVSLAEKIIPASNLSEQISTAGTEASGTGNMKFALNGALTIGTLDGANIEILEEVGEENIFIFGLNSAEVDQLRNKGYNPADYYNSIDSLKKTIDMISSGFFSPDEKTLFEPIANSLLYHDRYLLFADYESYIKTQRQVEKEFSDKKIWTKKSIFNVAGSGKFSSDRTIAEYNKNIWRLKSVPIKMGRK
ncbi:MAG: glycogen/starch/alpha-glucan phosphorylase [Spirochaetaceae bacterium]|nr:glycogen/starch/alpha-glucan phosphorylase [Spirochaetaceae bacterium]